MMNLNYYFSKGDLRHIGTGSQGLRLLCVLVLSLLCTSASAQGFPDLFGFLKKPKNQYVRVSTEKGECIIKLYNETPRHRDNFVKLVKKDFYRGTLFHRVINSFMIQGGDPQSRNAKPGQMLGEGDLGYRIPAEFNPLLFHKKGALAAARDDNPAKSSSACQFYIVQGRTYSDEELSNVEQKRLEGRKIPAAQRKVYQTVGGTPFLDQKYTVFGEVVRGISMVDSIAAVPTDGNDRPLSNIPVNITMLRKKDARNLEKELAREAFKNKLIMENPKTAR